MCILRADGQRFSPRCGRAGRPPGSMQPIYKYLLGISKYLNTVAHGNLVFPVFTTSIFFVLGSDRFICSIIASPAIPLGS